MAKQQLFNGLVKYAGADYSKYTGAKNLGKLVFAEITEGDNKGKYIYANGIEYKIADATAFDTLTARVNAFEIEAVDDKLILKGLDTDGQTVKTYAEIPLADSTYVKLETVDGSIQASLDENQMVFAATTSGHIDDQKIATDGWVKDQLDKLNEEVDERLDNLDASVADLSTRMQRVESSANTYYDNALQTVIVTDDDYINASFGEKTGNAGDKSQTLTIGIDPAALTKATDSHAVDVSIATKGYVDEQVAKAIAGGVVYKGMATDLPDTAQNGDMYKMTNDQQEKDPKWHVGDVAIYYIAEGQTTGEWQIIPAGDDLEWTGVKVGDTFIISPTAGGDVTFVAETGTGALIQVAGDASAKTVTYTATDRLKDAVQTVEDLSFTANTSTADYIDIHALYDGELEKGMFDLSIGVKIVDISTATATNTGLVDAYNVKQELDKIKSQVDNLDVESTEVADKILVGVSQEDGLIASTAASLKINDVSFTHAVGSADMTVTISGNDTLIGGDDDAWKDVSISKAITDLSTAIDNIADNIITGEDALTPGTGTAANDDYVAVTATRDAETGNVTLDSSVLVATNTVDADIKDNNADVADATPTGLATDAYVKNAIINALAWEVLD